jgi:hypothetical protein
MSFVRNRSHSSTSSIFCSSENVPGDGVRFLDPRPGATEQDHDRRTDATIAKIAATGEAFFGGTTWRGQRCMRVSVCNWQTGEADVDHTVQTVERVLGGVRP